jgi:hypothetical protein
MKTGLEGRTMDRQEMLKALEADVAGIKDHELRKIAFEKLLSQALGELKGKGGKKKKKAQLVRGEKGKGTHKSSQYYSIESVREEVKKLNIAGKMKDLIPFNDCKEHWERYLWVLAAAKNLGIDGLSNHEIAYVLGKRLFSKTKYSSVNNIRRKVRDGVVHSDPETNLWMITPQGEEHLASLG